MPLPEILTVPEAAAILGITDTAVRSLCDRGHLPGARKAGRMWLIPRAAVQARKRATAKGKLPKGGRPPAANP